MWNAADHSVKSHTYTQCVQCGTQHIRTTPKRWTWTKSTSSNATLVASSFVNRMIWTWITCGKLHKRANVMNWKAMLETISKGKRQYQSQSQSKSQSQQQMQNHCWFDILEWRTHLQHADEKHSIQNAKRRMSKCSQRTRVDNYEKKEKEWSS